MLIGLANVGLGIVIFSFTYNGNFSMWAGLCATGLGAMSLLQVRASGEGEGVIGGLSSGVGGGWVTGSGDGRAQHGLPCLSASPTWAWGS